MNEIKTNLTPADEGRQAATKDKAMQARLGLVRDTWITGDTCWNCGHDGMAFLAERRITEPAEGDYFKGEFRCLACGSFEKDVFINEDLVPDGILIKKD